MPWDQHKCSGICDYKKEEEKKERPLNATSVSVPGKRTFPQFCAFHSILDYVTVVCPYMNSARGHVFAVCHLDLVLVLNS